MEVKVVYCPACETKGKRTKLELYQINLNVAVYICKQLNCLYPEGYSWIYVDRSLDDINEQDDDSSDDYDFDQIAKTYCDSINSSTTPNRLELLDNLMEITDFENIKSPSKLNTNGELNQIAVDLGNDLQTQLGLPITITVPNLNLTNNQTELVIESTDNVNTVSFDKLNLNNSENSNSVLKIIKNRIDIEDIPVVLAESNEGQQLLQSVSTTKSVPVILADSDKGKKILESIGLNKSSSNETKPNKIVKIIQLRTNASLETFNSSTVQKIINQVEHEPELKTIVLKSPAKSINNINEDENEKIDYNKTLLGMENLNYLFKHKKNIKCKEKKTVFEKFPDHILQNALSVLSKSASKFEGFQTRHSKKKQNNSELIEHSDCESKMKSKNNVKGRKSKSTDSTLDSDCENGETQTNETRKQNKSKKNQKYVKRRNLLSSYSDCDDIQSDAEIETNESKKRNTSNKKQNDRHSDCDDIQSDTETQTDEPKKRNTTKRKQTNVKQKNLRSSDSALHSDIHSDAEIETNEPKKRNATKTKQTYTKRRNLRSSSSVLHSDCDDFHSDAESEMNEPNKQNTKKNMKQINSDSTLHSSNCNGIESDTEIKEEPEKKQQVMKRRVLKSIDGVQLDLKAEMDDKLKNEQTDEKEKSELMDSALDKLLNDLDNRNPNELNVSYNCADIDEWLNSL